MAKTRKITVEVPEDLLTRAQEASGEGITETARRGLGLVAAGQAYAGERGSPTPSSLRAASTTVSAS